MIDRKKVLNGLECCGSPIFSKKNKCIECPYNCSDLHCISRLTTDALELLKEQEAQIKLLEHDLAVTQNNLNYYVNGND